MKIETGSITIIFAVHSAPKMVASKQVRDYDGFLTDYTWYLMPDGTHKFVFGDKDFYGPEDEADWECDSYEEASEWFEDYNGIDDLADEIQMDLDEMLSWMTIR